jgi:hypothetical protein
MQDYNRVKTFRISTYNNITFSVQILDRLLHSSSISLQSRRQIRALRRTFLYIHSSSLILLDILLTHLRCVPYVQYNRTYTGLSPRTLSSLKCLQLTSAGRFIQKLPVIFLCFGNVRLSSERWDFTSGKLFRRIKRSHLHFYTVAAPNSGGPPMKGRATLDTIYL